MKTLHVYSNRHIRAQVKTIKLDDWVYLENRLSQKRWSMYFRANGIDESALDINYITHQEFFDLNNVQFDAIVGNPPYQDSNNAAKNVKLWAEFAHKVINLNPPVIAFVTPNAAFKDVDSNGNRVRSAMMNNKYGLVEFVNHGRTVFKDVGVETSHWIISKNSDISIEEAIFSNIHPVAASISDKVTSYPAKLPLRMMNGDIASSELNKEGIGSLIYFTGSKPQYTESTLKDPAGELKVVIPFSSSYHKSFATIEATGMLNMAMPVKDDNEANFILEYIMSPLFKLVAATYKKTSGFTPFAKNAMIPDLRGVTTDLYSIFGLTQEEVAYIEEAITEEGNITK